MCSKHVEAWNKLTVKQKFCASSYLISEINILWCTVSKTSTNNCCSFVYGDRWRHFCIQQIMQLLSPNDTTRHFVMKLRSDLFLDKPAACHSRIACLSSWMILVCNRLIYIIVFVIKYERRLRQTENLVPRNILGYKGEEIKSRRKTYSRGRTDIVSVATRLRDGWKGTEIPFRTVDFLMAKHVRTGSGVHPDYIPMGTEGFSPG